MSEHPAQSAPNAPAPGLADRLADGPADGTAMLRGAALRLAVLALAASAVVGALAGTGSLDAGAAVRLARRAPFALPATAGLGFVFILAKARALVAAARANELTLSTGGAVRLFCESAVVDVVSWPGKLWSDVYKYARLGPGQREARLATLIAFRLAGAATLVILLAAAGACLSLLEPVCNLVPGAGPVEPVALLLAVGAVAALALTRRSGWRPGVPRRHLAGGLHALPWALAAGLADVAAITTLATWLTGADPLVVAAGFVLAAAAGIASTAPIGAGVLDVGVYLVLTELGGVAPTEAVAVVVLYRVLGPLQTLAVGGVSLLARCGAMVRVTGTAGNPNPLKSA